jgi:hypothetical protein
VASVRRNEAHPVSAAVLLGRLSRG